MAIICRQTLRFPSPKKQSVHTKEKYKYLKGLKPKHTIIARTKNIFKLSFFIQFLDFIFIKIEQNLLRDYT